MSRPVRIAAMITVIRSRGGPDQDRTDIKKRAVLRLLRKQAG
ncbi:hypothetical protein AB0H42_00740 [Nocardia sp. NPDC050799]